MLLRHARTDEIDHLARIWSDGWRDAHLHIVPAALTKLRTLQNFRDRLSAALSSVRVVAVSGSTPALGFSMVREDELYQLYVAAPARGTGAAAALLHDAEARVAAQGHRTIWLACAIGNARAARFYEKSGWHRAGTFTQHTETSEGPFALEVWRYEKELRP